MSSDVIRSLIEGMNSAELKTAARSAGSLVLQAEAVGCDVDLTPLSSGSNTPWVADDRDWFRANLLRACRRRAAFEGETSGPGLQLIHVDELGVQVSFFLPERWGITLDTVTDDDASIRGLMLERFALINVRNPLGPPRKPDTASTPL